MKLKDLPADYKYVAIDASGRTYAYEHKPIPSYNGCWEVGMGGWLTVDVEEIATPPHADWKDTLYSIVLRNGEVELHPYAQPVAPTMPPEAGRPFVMVTSTQLSELDKAKKHAKLLMDHDTLSVATYLAIFGEAP